jgi:hypothetical protein
MTVDVASADAFHGDPPNKVQSCGELAKNGTTARNW